MELIFPEFILDFPAVDGDPGFSFRAPSIRVLSGEITFVMGHNGSGKSVFLGLLAGEIKNQLEGRRRDSWKQVAFVRQKAELSLATELTVRENLLLRFDAHSILRGIFPARFFHKKLEDFVRGYPELSRKLDQPCGRLSVGQRQTLAFLAVTARKSKLLLLDEFLAATDYSTSSLLLGLARQYALENPAGVIIVSHDIDLALREASRIIVFRHGGMVRDLRLGSVEWNAESLVELLSPVRLKKESESHAETLGGVEASR